MSRDIVDTFEGRVSGCIRFEAALPNELWQADTTHWRLADGSDVEILNL